MTRLERVIRAQLLRLQDLHSRYPHEGMGYRLGGLGEYGTIESCCRTCGTPDEYAEAWPCETRQHIDTALTAWPDAMSGEDRDAENTDPIRS